MLFTESEIDDRFDDLFFGFFISQSVPHPSVRSVDSCKPTREFIQYRDADSPEICRSDIVALDIQRNFLLNIHMPTVVRLNDWYAHFIQSRRFGNEGLVYSDLDLALSAPEFTVIQRNHSRQYGVESVQWFPFGDFFAVQSGNNGRNEATNGGANVLPLGRAQSQQS